MPVTVKIPIPLQRLAGGKEEVIVRAGTIASIIDEMNNDFPGVKERIADNGKIRRYVNIYINGEDIRLMQNEETEAKDGDEIMILPAISGG